MRGNAHFATALLLAVLSGGCALVDGTGGQNAPTLTDDKELAVVRSVLAWIRKEIANVDGRRFDLAAADFDYRGSDVTLRTLVSVVREDSARFQPAQTFVRDVLREPLLPTVLDQVSVAILSDAEMNALGHGDLNGAFLDGKLYFRRAVIATATRDPRPVCVLVVHELLHALGLPNDPDAAVFGAANGGLLAVPALAIPSEMSSMTSGDVIQRLAALMVLLSNDYRGARVGDDPGNATTYVWTTANDHDFGGVGPNGAAFVDSPVPGWSQPDGRPLKQYDGFHIALPAPFDDIETFVGQLNLVTTASYRHFRVSAEFAAPPTAIPFEGSITHAGYGIRFWRSGPALVLWNGGNWGQTQSQYFVNKPHPFRVTVELSALERQRTLRVNGVLVCSFLVPTEQNTPVVLNGKARLDRLKFEVGTAVTP